MDQGFDRVFDSFQYLEEEPNHDMADADRSGTSSTTTSNFTRWDENSSANKPGIIWGSSFKCCIEDNPVEEKDIPWELPPMEEPWNCGKLFEIRRTPDCPIECPNDYGHGNIDIDICFPESRLIKSLTGYCLLDICFIDRKGRHTRCLFDCDSDCGRDCSSDCRRDCGKDCGRDCSSDCRTDWTCRGECPFDWCIARENNGKRQHCLFDCWWD